MKHYRLLNKCSVYHFIECSMIVIFQNNKKKTRNVLNSWIENK